MTNFPLRVITFIFCVCVAMTILAYNNFSKGVFWFNIKLIYIFLRLGNKQDNEGALNEDELHRRLELDTLMERYKCPCQVVS